MKTHNMMKALSALTALWMFAACGNTEENNDDGSSADMSTSVNNTSGGTTSDNNTSGNNTSGNNTTDNNTSGNNTSGGTTSDNNTSGNNTTDMDQDMSAGPTCADNTTNGGESDVDCGGPECSPCEDGLSCVDDADCQSGLCEDNLCEAPGLELGETCVNSEDCASEQCEALGSMSICTQPCVDSCPSADLACFMDLCVPSTFCENENGVGNGPGCQGSPCSSCDLNAMCMIETDGSATCTCNEGFEGDGATCADIDECSTGAAMCDSNASCSNRDGGFDCTCNSGYEGDGAMCADVDECSNATLNNCDANAMCANTQGSFSCSCNAGFTGDGVTCVSASSTTGDTCVAPLTITLTNGTFVDTGDTTSFMDDYSFGDSECPGVGLTPRQTFPDVVYEFTPPMNMDVTFTVTTNSWGSSLYVVTDCTNIANTCLGANVGNYNANLNATFPDMFTGDSELTVSMQANTQYFIIIDGARPGVTNFGTYTFDATVVVP